MRLIRPILLVIIRFSQHSVVPASLGNVANLALDRLFVISILHSRPYLHHIYGEQEPLWTLANCTLSSLYENIRQVYQSVTSSNGESILLEKVGLETVAR